MPEKSISTPGDGRGGRRGRHPWVLVATAAACVVVLVMFRLQGLILLVPILLVALMVLRYRPDATEVTALRSSISLSAEDLRDVLDEFDRFSDDADADALADRTLHRPALLDQDCSDPEIEEFHYQQATARRFLNRLEARLANPDLEIGQLETLLSVTDQRVLELRESWLTARQAAKRLGPNY